VWGKTSLANVVAPLLSVMEKDFKGRSVQPRLVVKVNVHQGDGFSTVWNRVFGEISTVENTPVIGINPQPIGKQVPLKSAFGISEEPTIDEVRRTVSLLPRAVFIFDEFDRGSVKLRTQFTDLIKALSDYAVDCTIVVVGVSSTVDELIGDHASIVRAVVQIQLPRMNERELGEILEKGSAVLGIQFQPKASNLIIRMSQGLPHYTHLIGLHATRCAVNRRSRVIQVEDVQGSFAKAISQSIQSTQTTYLTAVHSAHKDALYDKVILACAVASASAKDNLGYFHSSDVIAPMSQILDRPAVPIAAFQRHIHEFCEKPRAEILEKAGVPRAYKYRFRDPLLPSYVFMKAIAEGLINPDRFAELVSAT
jgi:hypothetical protein